MAIVCHSIEAKGVASRMPFQTSPMFVVLSHLPSGPFEATTAAAPVFSMMRA
jgi:hypothetical protein